MDEHIRRIKNLTGTLINPATEDTLLEISGLNTLASPVTKPLVACSNVRTSYTISAGKHTLIIRNTGAKILAWGGSTVTYDTGDKLVPTEGYLFKGCVDGFTVYFICNGADTTNISI